MATRTVRSQYEVAAKDKTRGTLKAIERQFGAIDKKVGTLRNGLVGLAGAAGFGGLAFSIKSVINAGTELERQQFKIDALLRSTGGAVGFTRKELDGMAEAIEKNTLATGQGVREAIGILLSFKTISGETFRETLELSADVATVMGRDIKSGAYQMAKALEDPIANLGSLTEAGVSFNAMEKEMIKSLASSGQQLQAQTLILEKIRGQLGGAARGEATGLAGATHRVSSEWTDLKENLANTTAWTTATNAVAGLLGKINEFFNQDAEKQIANYNAQIAILRHNLEANPNANEATRIYAQRQIDSLTILIRTLEQQVDAENAEAEAARKNADAQKILAAIEKARGDQKAQLAAQTFEFEGPRNDTAYIASIIELDRQLYDQRMALAHDFHIQMYDEWKEGNDRIVELENYKRDTIISNAGAILGNLAAIVGSNSKKQFEWSKKLARAEVALSIIAATQKAFESKAKFGVAAASAEAFAAYTASAARLVAINRTSFNSSQSAAAAAGAGGFVPTPSPGPITPGGNQSNVGEAERIVFIYAGAAEPDERTVRQIFSTAGRLINTGSMKFIDGGSPQAAEITKLVRTY